MMNNSNDYFGQSLTKSNNHTPNRHTNITNSLGGTPIEYNNAEFPNHLESNGKIVITEISDVNELNKRFNELENSIRNFCIYYESLSDIFLSVNIEIKNKLVDYLTRFNNRFLNFVEKQTNDKMEDKKNSEDIKNLKEELNKAKKEKTNLTEKFQKEKEELKLKYRQKKEELRNTIKEDTKKINECNNQILQKNKEIEEKTKKIDYLQELNKNLVPGSSDYINISYGLGERLNIIDIDIPHSQEFKNFSDGFKSTEADFNRYAKELVDTRNKTLDKFKELYLKIKGKNWSDSDNSLNEVHFGQTFNINQKFSWSNIINILFNLQSIINKIFELVNPTQKCDPKKLNEDSCEFLLNYIIGLRKLFFVQKNILDNTFYMGDTYAEKIQNFESFKKVTEEAEKFFSENNHIINNQTYFGRFKEELKEENVKDLSVEEYIKNIKSVLVQAKNISDKNENEYNEYIKNLELQNNRTTTEDIEIEFSNTKSKKINSDNGI